ncbi:5-(carboxyamino)imidazole ribonucleotide synthase [Nocardioides sp.]|uniref:5-(carboxyamino)imidazole ribonucleotide synthase n=1 Tax=Nocardioides sp. TaxID=35761 RepID=UPI0035161591
MSSPSPAAPNQAPNQAQSEALAPTIAVIGGGQLARMMAEPAAALGLPLRLLAEAPGVSAAQVIPDHVVGDYRDLATLREVTAGAAVVTFDHEHVPTDHLRALAADGVGVHPGPEALVHAQDKAVMRERLSALGAPCPRFARIADAADLAAFGFPCVLKTTRGGYDGKGVWFVREPADAEPAFAAAAASGVELLAEELVDFARELSAIVVRAPSGQAAAYPVVATTQLDGICHEVIAPAPDLPEERATAAQQLALRLAGELGVTGVLAVELFETADGTILVNELAMRPHNTGHWTQDGAVTSQFENHLRAVLDLPLGAPDPRARWTVMVNILGAPDREDGTPVGRLYDGYPHALARDPRLRVHLYGKSMRPGRKVGHVNAYGEDLEDCLERARHAAAWFRGDLGDESE